MLEDILTHLEPRVKRVRVAFELAFAGEGGIKFPPPSFPPPGTTEESRNAPWAVSLKVLSHHGYGGGWCGGVCCGLVSVWVGGCVGAWCWLVCGVGVGRAGVSVVMTGSFVLLPHAANDPQPGCPRFVSRKLPFSTSTAPDVCVRPSPRDVLRVSRCTLLGAGVRHEQLPRIPTQAGGRTSPSTVCSSK